MAKRITRHRVSPTPQPRADGSLPAGAGGADAAEARVRHVARLARMHSAEEAALAAGRAWRAAQWVPAMEGSLRDWRGRLGWTQAEAAAALGLSLRAYQAAEQSGRPCRRERVLACWCIESLARGARGEL